jgi:3-mercaptopyruvate sulfurtransferase SseA
MRRMTSVAIASVFVAGLASAQMKVPQQKPPMAGSPVTLTPTQAAEAPLESARRIPRDEAMKLVKAHKAIFIDVRSKDSWETGHIPGALSIPLSELNNRLRELPPGKMLITYCA